MYVHRRRNTATVQTEPCCIQQEYRWTHIHRNNRHGCNTTVSYCDACERQWHQGAVEADRHNIRTSGHRKPIRSKLSRRLGFETTCLSLHDVDHDLPKMEDDINKVWFNSSGVCEGVFVCVMRSRKEKDEGNRMRKQGEAHVDPTRWLRKVTSIIMYVCIHCAHYGMLGEVVRYDLSCHEMV